MPIWPPGSRPSERITAVLRGRKSLEDEDASIQSVCSRYIYEGAAEILSIPTLDGRRKALSKIPPLIRPHIEAEIMWLHKKRRR